MKEEATSPERSLSWGKRTSKALVFALNVITSRIRSDVNKFGVRAVLSAAVRGDTLAAEEARTSDITARAVACTAFTAARFRLMFLIIEC